MLSKLTSIELALTHGVLDGASGGPGQGTYTELASRDGLNYKSPSVLSHLHGKIQGLGKNEWIYYPPNGAFDVPYLPDVMGCGVSLLGLPGAGGNRVIVPFGTDCRPRWEDRIDVRGEQHARGCLLPARIRRRVKSHQLDRSG